MAVLGVIAHCTSKAGIRMNPIIRLRQLGGSHTGSNIAVLIMEILRDYGIAEKLGYLMGDNATNEKSTEKSWRNRNSLISRQER